MKKVTLFMFASMFAFTSTVAFAVSKPNWERPILKAQLEVVSATGHFEIARNVLLTMTKRDENRLPTGLTLRYESPVGELTPAFRVVTADFRITEIWDMGCGSVEYEAQWYGSEGSAHSFTIVLQDHTRRFCKDFKPHHWEAFVSEGGFCMPHATMQLVGNPEAIFSPLE